MTLEEFYKAIKDMPENIEVWTQTNALCYDTSVSFEVHVTSDQGEGSEWIEIWSIDNDGKIYSEDTIYENYEEFLGEWS